MCIFGNSGGGTKLPVTPPVTKPAPTPGKVVTTATDDALLSDANKRKAANTAISQNAVLGSKRQGVFGNTRTAGGVMGDVSYGSASSGYATFGGGRKAA